MQYDFERAIARHLEWAGRFRDAIASRDLTEAIENCAYDDLCEFGIWLYSLDEDVKFTPGYRAVKDLHYQFHLAASLVVAQMRARHFEAARQMVAGDFTEVSDRLVAAIRAWRGEVGGE
jgi:hypothetical protein